MPSLPIYLYDDDTATILGLLNNDPEAAIIVSDGPSRWKAVASLSTLAKGRHAIWHVPSGPLPLLGKDDTDKPTWVGNPWEGWQEERSGHDTSTPYFGTGHPGVIWLNTKNEAGGCEERVGFSGFEWIGRRYDGLGHSASAETDRWWKRLASAVRRTARKVPRGGTEGSGKPEVFAFPEAALAIQRGVPADVNP
jgi:hypothetical protein